MVAVRGAFAHSLVPGFKRVLFNAWKERPLEGKRLVNMQTSKRAYEEDFEFAGFGTLRKKPEGADVMYEDPKQGDIKRYTWDTFALGYRITMEMMEDDLYALFGNKLSAALGRSARNNFEVIAHAPFNNGFNTAFNGFTAGEALFGSHVSLKTGGTILNTPATPTDLDIVALQGAWEHFDNLTDHVGMPAMLIPKKLVYSGPNHWIAHQLLKTPQLPGGNQNDINQIAKEGFTPELSHFLIDKDFWFVQADWHDVNMYERRKFTFASNDNFRTGDAEYRGLARRGSGFGSWRGHYGSEGV